MQADNRSLRKRNANLQASLHDLKDSKRELQEEHEDELNEIEREHNNVLKKFAEQIDLRAVGVRANTKGFIAEITSLNADVRHLNSRNIGLAKQLSSKVEELETDNETLRAQTGEHRRLLSEARDQVRDLKRVGNGVWDHSIDVHDENAQLKVQM